MLTRGSVCLVLLAATFATLALSPLAAGCRQRTAIEAKGGDALHPGVAISIDLDGDGTAEKVLIESQSGRLTITDDSTIYHSRQKWRVAAACLGDTDNNGLPEVLALLDASDGRHLGLFGYSSDGDLAKYRERLVTGVLRPKPLAMKVLTVGEAAGESGGSDGSTSGDILVLTEEIDSGLSGASTGSRDTTYRWNGFGFTALGIAK